MVAAVLGHEMTHGFNQHIANSAAKSTWANALSGMANSALSASNFGVGVGLTGLSDATLRFLTVKNINVADEKDADRNGFYVMASAGFNPSDHPDTRNRLKDMAELLHKFGIGHTEVKNVNDIYFDKELLLTAEPDGMQDAEEMAYLMP